MIQLDFTHKGLGVCWSSVVFTHGGLFVQFDGECLWLKRKLVNHKNKVGGLTREHFLAELIWGLVLFVS